MPGFLGQHRGLLEPGEAEHRDHRQHPDRAEPLRRQGRRGQRGEAEVAARRAGEPGDGLGQDHGDLDRGQRAQDPPGDIDPQQAQHGDDRPRAQRPYPPGRVYAQVGGGLAGGGRAEHPVQGDLQAAVGRQRDQRRGHADGAAEPLGDERVERSRVHDVPAHRHVPGGEDGQDHRDADERGRDGGQAGHPVGGRDQARRDGQRGHPGQDEGQHGGHAEPVLGQRAGHRAGLGRGRLH